MRGLSDPDLNGLQVLLTALSFGQETCDRLDAKDSLFNRVARDLGVNMKNHWRPDAAFLGKRNREQLVTIAVASGYTDSAGQLSKYKKADLVNALARYFEGAKAASDPTAQQITAREWLPEAMLFLRSIRICQRRTRLTRKTRTTTVPSNPQPAQLAPAGCAVSLDNPTPLAYRPFLSGWEILISQCPVLSGTAHQFLQFALHDAWRRASPRSTCHRRRCDVEIAHGLDGFSQP